MSNIIIVGLGESGKQASRLAAGRGDTVFITEIKDNAGVRKIADSLLKDKLVLRQNIEIGSHSKRFIKEADLMVISPGVRSDSLPVKLAEERGIPVISELELAYSVCRAPIIAVTGTSGKTTVTTLIGEMLRRQGLDAIVCGNIGNPLSGEIKKIKDDSIVVTEVSSFQLERIKDFKPEVSIILNISENHLDRHRDMEEYISVKSRIFFNQGKDNIVFLNGKDKILRQISHSIKARVEFFDEYKDFKNRLNIENDDFLAAMAVSSCKGVTEDVMLSVISGFKGIEHRLEHVLEINGIGFINDSKATTISSVRWALESLNGRLILIMGGKYKGGEFSKLKGLIKEKAICIMAIGEAAPRIKRELGMMTDIFEAETLQKAVRNAFEKAGRGDKVLLSPGCSSFDMFRDYEERGRVFKEECFRLAKNPVQL